MVEKDITITNSLGLHARPASMIVQKALEFPCDITLKKDETSANAKSIMNIMLLAANSGSSVTLITDGKKEKEAAEAIETLFKNKFNEE